MWIKLSQRSHVYDSHYTNFGVIRHAIKYSMTTHDNHIIGSHHTAALKRCCKLQTDRPTNFWKLELSVSDFCKLLSFLLTIGKVIAEIKIAGYTFKAHSVEYMYRTGLSPCMNAVELKSPAVAPTP